jgi:hypothetical protein
VKAENEMMKELRRWQLDSTKPISLQLAADARLSPNDYVDDQIWELQLGALESPALALQTQYGGRVGLASLVPMWFHGGRVIYQAQTYTKPPVLTAFAPSYLKAEAKLTSTLNLQAEFWAMESHAVGVRFALQNASASVEKLRLDVFGHVIQGDKEQPLTVIALKSGGNALSMGEIANLQPVVMLERGSAETSVGEQASPKIGVTLEIPSKGVVTLRWVHAGLPILTDSLALARAWLEQDWKAHLARIAHAAQRIPIVETGKADWDTAIAFSYQQLVQSFLRPTSSLPHGSFIAARQSWQGYSPRGDGSDYPRTWSGQSPTLAYLVAPVMASIDPQMAQGIIRNYLAIQSPDGWIDDKPGLGGQRENQMVLPLLACLAWKLYQQTEDKTFIAEVFPALMRFFERWFQADLDHDSDGLPEWQSERQTGYVYTPTFAISQSWGQGADIRYVETPHMAAYLLSEAISLQSMAALLNEKKASNVLEKRISTLQSQLESLWQNGRYAYRDRDTHQTNESVTVLDKGRGDEDHILALTLNPPNRLIVTVTGGGNLTPRVVLHVEGLGHDEKKVVEMVESKAFTWGYGRGVYTTQHIFAQVDRIRAEGLSRVYEIHARTVDTTRRDINALLPFFSGAISKERANALVKLLLDKRQFWRENGMTMNSAQDPNFDPSNAQGSGGVWMYWVTLIGEGLLHYGYHKQAAELLKRILKVQAEVLTQRKKFSEAYHSDESQGIGERGHLAGIVPLHFMMRVFGVRIISSGKVYAGGAFEWEKPVTIKQHGVMVKRSKSGTQVEFPSGHKAKLEAGHGWQEIIDPKPVSLPSISPAPDLPMSKEKSQRASPKSVIIEVQHEDE